MLSQEQAPSPLRLVDASVLQQPLLQEVSADRLPLSKPALPPSVDPEPPADSLVTTALASSGSEPVPPTNLGGP